MGLSLWVSWKDLHHAGRRRGRVPLQRLSGKNIKAEPRTTARSAGLRLINPRAPQQAAAGFKSY